MGLRPRQSQIVNTALALIADKGIQNLTIKNLARRVGISEPAIYRHFDSKHEIIMTLLAQFEAQGNEFLHNLRHQDKSPLEKLEYFILDRYNRCIQDTNLAKVMFSEEHFQGNEQFATRMLGIMHRHSEEIHNIIVQGQEAGEIRNDITPSTIFRTVFGAVRLLVKQWCLSNFAFDLLTEGSSLWRDQCTILKTSAANQVSNK